MSALPQPILEPAKKEEGMMMKKVVLAALMIAVPVIACAQEETVLQKTLKRMDGAGDLQRALLRTTTTDWEWKVAGYQAILGTNRRIQIHWLDATDGRIVAGRYHRSGAIGFSYRTYDGTCHVNVRGDMTDRHRETTLAHETCHCAFDYDYFNADGWINSSEFDIVKGERRAAACEEWLTNDTNYSDWVHAKRTGWLPEAFADWRPKRK